MKVRSATVHANGKSRVSMELEPGEKLIVVKAGLFYRLGEPMDEVMPAHVLEAIKPVHWCPVEQKWVYA